MSARKLTNLQAFKNTLLVLFIDILHCAHLLPRQGFQAFPTISSGARYQRYIKICRIPDNLSNRRNDSLPTGTSWSTDFPFGTVRAPTDPIVKTQKKSTPDPLIPSLHPAQAKNYVKRKPFTDFLIIVLLPIVILAQKHTDYTDIKTLDQHRGKLRSLWKILLWILGFLVVSGPLYWFVLAKKHWASRKKLIPFDRLF